jgi:ABC-type antimicrobial peptide transport system permease subunit
VLLVGAGLFIIAFCACCRRIRDFTSQVEATLRPLIPDLPKGSMRPLSTLLDRAVSPRRFVVFLLTGFAAFALILASLGIYVVISYSVARRTQEIGIRIALGAQAGRVQLKIVMQTLGLAAIGLTIGALAASAVGRGLSSLLFGVKYSDPFTFLASVVVMLSVVLLAGYLPAYAASRIDPIVASGMKTHRIARSSRLLSQQSQPCAQSIAAFCDPEHPGASEIDRAIQR